MTEAPLLSANWSCGIREAAWQNSYEISSDAECLLNWEILSRDKPVQTHHSRVRDTLTLLHINTDAAPYVYSLTYIGLPQKYIIHLTVKYPSRWFCCQLQSLGDITCNNICFFSDVNMKIPDVYLLLLDGPQILFSS